jgi:hypothetical protein
MAAGMWGTGILESRGPGTLRAASMIMSAVAWAAWWAASGSKNDLLRSLSGST